MTRNPVRETVEGRVYLDLQRLARNQGRPTDELHQLYALEGFLQRLARSEYRERLVLKGGVLLAAYDARRPTRDVDLHARGLSNDAAVVRRTVLDITSVQLSEPDGLEFERDGLTARQIRDHAEYSGIRVSLRARLSRARIFFHVDFNVGDPIWPAPQEVVLPRLLGGVIRVRGYPLAMVYAEKILTMLERGTANSRWRDFADVYQLSRGHPVDGVELRHALTEVASFRALELRPLARVLDGYAAVAQQRWKAWRTKQHLEARLPESFDEVLDSVVQFADPVLADERSRRTWDPRHRRWTHGSSGA